MATIPNIECEGLAKGAIFRIIYTEAEVAVLFDLQSKQLAFSFAWQSTLRDWEVEGIVERQPHDQLDRKSNGVSLSEVQISERDARFKQIAPLLDQVPAIFDRMTRARAIRSLIEGTEDSPSGRTLKNYLHLYWRHGMTPDALLPQFQKCGGPGRAKTRGMKPLGKKRRKTYGNPYAPTSEDMYEIFERFTNIYYKKTERGSLTRTFRRIEGYYVTQFLIDEGGGVIERTRDDWDTIPLPTFRQYQYWYEKRGRREADEIARSSETSYLKTKRARVGSSSVDLVGVGSRFEIDATTFDISCVSESNRRESVGRPTLFLVVDVFSKMIVGMHLTLENASWREAGIALRNTVEDKVEFCSRFGVDIAEEDWPVKDFMPARLLGDRGELENTDPSNFVLKTGVTIENTAPYRGDMKGSVEKRFDMIHAMLRDILPGMVSKNQAEKGDKDYRRKAKLTLSELTAAVIRTVIFLNNNNLLSRYHHTKEMIADDVEAVPRRMWNWAIDKGHSELRKVAPELIRMAVMPTGKGRSGKDGIEFKQLTYISDRHRQGRLSEIRAMREVTASFDHKDTNQIWLHNPDGSYEVCRLHPKCSAFADLTFDEAHSEIDRIRKAEAKEKAARSAEFYQHAKDLEKSVRKAKQFSGTDLTNSAIGRSANTRRQEAANKLDEDRSQAVRIRRA